MNMTRIFAVCVAAIISCAAMAQQEGEDVLNIGSRLELFVDDYLIDTTRAVTQELHSPKREEVAIVYDAPWEGEVSFYVTVFQDGDIYRMYYRGQPITKPLSEYPNVYGPAYTCYAESTDGIHWTKPRLGLFECQGTKDNNIVWAGEGVHNFSPFKDTNPNCKPEEQYKAVAGGPLIALASPDGIHWRKMQNEPVITEGAFDSHNLAFYDNVRGEYRAYVRDFAKGVRTIRTCTSQDFIHWTKPQWCGYGDTPPEHLYTNATIPYFRAPHIFVAFPKRYVPNRKKLPDDYPIGGISEGCFMSTRDGVNFHRWMEAWIRPGLDIHNWCHRNNGPAWGILQTGPGEMSVYWIEHYHQSGVECRLRRGTLRTDGFVSVNAPYSGGEFTTKPLTFEGRELVINYSTSAVGSVQVEIQDAGGAPFEDFTLAQCPEIYGDEIEHVVAWEGGSDVSALAGRPVRLRFVMKDADLYSIRFRP